MASINFEFLHDEDGDGKDEEEANLQGKADLHSRFDALSMQFCKINYLFVVRYTDDDSLGDQEMEGQEELPVTVTQRLDG